MSTRLLGGEDEQKWPGWLGQEDCMGRWWALIVAQLGLGSYPSNGQHGLMCMRRRNRRVICHTEDTKIK